MNGKYFACAICSGGNLSAYLDGMLDGKTLRAIDAHLHDCQNCREELNALEEARALVHELRSTTPTAPDMLWADIYRTARQSQMPPPSPERFTVPGVFKLGVVATSVGLLVAFGANMFVTTPHASPQIGSLVPQIADQVDVSSLISAHANYVAEKKLADSSGNRIIRSDLASQSSGDPALVPSDPLLSEAD